MKNFFEKVIGKNTEQEVEDPVVQAKEALEKYLEMLEQYTGEDTDKKDLERLAAPELSAVTGVKDLEDIKAMVQEAVVALDSGDLRRAMAFLSARSSNLYLHYLGPEKYFEEAKDALAKHINTQLESGELKVEDVATLTVELKASDKMLIKKPHWEIAEGEESIGENLTLYLIPNGKIAIKKANGELEIEDRNNSKWEVFFRQR